MVRFSAGVFVKVCFDILGFHRVNLWALTVDAPLEVPS